MNSDRVNRWLNLIANVGVLIGVIFVAVGLRQNEELARAATRQEIAHDSFTPALAIATDESLAEALQKKNSGQEITPTEEQRLITLMYATYIIYENINFQYQAGMLAEDQWRTFMSGMKNISCTNATREYLNPELYSEEFQRVIEEYSADC